MFCLFTSDLHGHVDRYAKLTEVILADRPQVVFLGGDLLPNHWKSQAGSLSAGFVSECMMFMFRNVREKLKDDYPATFLILADDPRCEEPDVLEAEREGLWCYMHGRKTSLVATLGCGGFEPGVVANGRDLG